MAVYGNVYQSGKLGRQNVAYVLQGSIVFSQVGSVVKDSYTLPLYEIKPDKKTTIIKPLTKTDLNPNYTFESFVVGDSNRMAVLTSLKVADNPGVVYNPLYIFGGVGLGKTHLMQAIGNYMLDKDINKKVLYVEAKEFCDDYIHACNYSMYRQMIIYQIIQERLEIII